MRKPDRSYRIVKSGETYWIESARTICGDYAMVVHVGVFTTLKDAEAALKSEALEPKPVVVARYDERGQRYDDC